jgi:LPS export ABC transporter permease LptF
VSRLDRYVIRELWGSFVVALASIGFAILLSKGFKIVSKTIDRDVPTSVLMKLLGLELPAVLLIALPMATVVAVLAGLGRLSSQSELTALRAAGLSPLRVFRPVAIFSLAVFLAASYVAHFLQPSAYVQRVALRTELVRSREPSKEIEPGVFFMRLPHAVLYTRSISESPQGRVLEGIYLQIELPGARPELIVATRGRVEFDRDAGRISLLLDDGEIHLLPHSDRAIYHRSGFDALTRVFPADIVFQQLTSKPLLNLRSKLRGSELLTEIDRIDRDLAVEKRERKRSSLLADQRELEVEFFARLAVPLGGLLMAFVSFPLATRIHRGGRLSGLGSSAILLLGYYLLLLIADGPASQEQGPAWVGPFIPILVFLAVGIVLWWTFVVRSGTSTLISRLLDAFRSAPHSILRWILALREATTKAPPEAHARAMSLGRLSLLDIYLGRAFVQHLLMVMGGFALIGFVLELRSAFALDAPTESTLSWADAARYALLSQPALLRFLLPLSALFASAIRIASLARAGELVALKAAGIGPWRLSLPLILVAIGLSLGYAAAQETLIPASERAAQRLRDHISGVPTANRAESGRQWIAGADERVWSFSGWDPTTKQLIAPMVAKIDFERGKLVSLLQAESSVNVNGLWRFRAVSRREFSSTAVRPDKAVSLEVDYTESPKLFGEDSSRLFGRYEADQLTLAELRESITRLASIGSPVTALRVYLLERLATPALPVLLTIVGCALVVSGWNRKASIAGFLMATLLSLLFWGLWAATLSLGRQGVLTPWAAAIVPPFLLGGLGALALTRAR